MKSGSSRIDASCRTRGDHGQGRRSRGWSGTVVAELANEGYRQGSSALSIRMLRPLRRRTPPSADGCAASSICCEPVSPGSMFCATLHRLPLRGEFVTAAPFMPGERRRYARRPHCPHDRHESAFGSSSIRSRHHLVRASPAILGSRGAAASRALGWAAGFLFGRGGPAVRLARFNIRRARTTSVGTSSACQAGGGAGSPRQPCSRIRGVSKPMPRRCRCSHGHRAGPADGQHGALPQLKNLDLHTRRKYPVLLLLAPALRCWRRTRSSASWLLAYGYCG